MKVDLNFSSATGSLDFAEYLKILVLQKSGFCEIHFIKFQVLETPRYFGNLDFAKYESVCHES